jgi:hypothetical protein
MDVSNQQFRIEPSRGLLQALCAMHLLAMLALATVDLPLLLIASLLLIVVCSLARQLHGYRRLRRSGGIVLAHDARGWRILGRDAGQVVEVLPETALTALGIVLRLRVGTRVRSLCVARDGIDADAMRRLRGLLVLCGTTPPERVSLATPAAAMRRG